MKLPKIYEHFKHGQIFTIEDARAHLGTTGNTLRKRLSELAARGYIYPIRQGLYRLHKIEERTERKVSPPFAIASRLTPECYIGFKSALQLHAKQIPSEKETIYVVSSTKFNSFRFENRLYFWCQNPDSHGIEIHSFRNNETEYTVRATNLEKSLIDCLKRPAHCPSLQELLSLCDMIERIPDLEKAFYYAANCHVKTVFNRFGFLLEKNQKNWSVPENLLHSIECEMSKKQTDWPILSDCQRTEMDAQEGRLRWKINFQNPNRNKNFI